MTFKPSHHHHLLASADVVVDCSPDVAYRYAIDLDRFGDWFPGVQAICAADTLAVDEPGKTYLETVAIPLRGTRSVCVVLKTREPHRHFATEAEFPPLLPRMEMDFAAVEPQRCRVRWRMYSRSRRRWFRWLLLPLARRVMQRRATRAMTLLGRQLDGRRLPT